MNKIGVVALASGLTLGICTISAFIGWAAGTSGNPQPSAPTTRPTVRATAAPAKVAAPRGLSLKSGTWEVGTEAKPGTYTTTADSIGCYWARLKSFDGGLDAIITNGTLAPGQRGRITVKPGDKGLELSGECVWSRV